MYNVINNNEVLNVRVYVKKEEKNAIIEGIVITIGFLAVSIYIFINFFKSGKTLIDALASFGTLLLFAIIFFAFSIYFIYFLIKRPRGFKAKLIDKKIENYNGQQITYMKFRVQKEREQAIDFIRSEYNCYTIGENNLIVENEYVLRIKEWNWEPKYVEELESNTSNKVASKVPNMTMSPVFFSIGLISGGMLFLCILGLVLYPQYAFTYIITSIFSGIGLYMTFKSNNSWKADNNIGQNENDLNLKLKLEKIKSLDKTQEKVGNIVIKNLLILMIVFPIVWFFIISRTNLEKEAFIIVFSMILFPELPIILMILFNIGYDERMIKKHNVNITENIDIVNTRSFNIFRPTKNTTFPQYFIIDSNKNLILKIKQANFIGNKYVICNQKNIKIGEIKSNLFSLTNEFMVSIVNEKPFIVRSKMQLNANYQVIGRDYYVKGDTHLIRNIIYDNNDNEIAYISAISKHNNNWYELGNMEVVLNNEVNNSMDIIIIALCITMGNFQTSDR